MSDPLVSQKDAPGREPTESSRESYHRRDTCRICGGRELEQFLSLGAQPLANAFLASPGDFSAESRYPLDVFFCSGCSLVQLLDVVSPSVLFDHYLYVTGTSDTVAEHNRRFARAVHTELGLGPGDLVVEAASNDGSLLSFFREAGARTIGVEPAVNIAKLAEAKGIETINRFFDEEAVRGILGSSGSAKAVIANNVLAHVDEPIDFLRNCRDLVSESGVVFIEVPYAGDMLERREYDTIYHEHLSYFAIEPLCRMAAAAGLGVRRVQPIPLHGGSVRLSLTRSPGNTPEVSSQIAHERRSGVTAPDSWRRFARSAFRSRELLVELLEEHRTAGARLAGYGAPAKGNTLLNFCDIGPDLLPFTVDRNPLKVGRWTPGMHIPVYAVEALEIERPDCVLILPWNFAEEIIRQQPAHASRGGRWLVPIPFPHEPETS